MKILNLEVNSCEECPMFQEIHCRYLAKTHNIHPAILGNDKKVIHKDCPFNKEVEINKDTERLDWILTHVEEFRKSYDYNGKEFVDKQLKQE